MGLWANNALEKENKFSQIDLIRTTTTGENIYMQNTISDFLFHLNICEIVNWCSTHLWVWMMTQVACCGDILLQIVLGTWQDQWRCSVWL